MSVHEEVWGACVSVRNIGCMCEGVMCECEDVRGMCEGVRA